MTDLVVRRLLVDMQQPLPRHWCGGDAFRTAFFNALSMSFPVGEQFFIDSVKAGLQALPPGEREWHATQVRGFVGQEATHRRLHALYNDHLAAQGLENRWGPASAERLHALADADPRHALGVTAAFEHFTAILADWLLHHPQAVASDDRRVTLLWLWHSAEESEHRSTAFDLYRALGGNEEWRRRWFRRVTLLFLGDAWRQTLHNLRRDGTLWRWRTWRDAARFLLGGDGLVRGLWRPWRDYLRDGFHPTAHDDSASRAWLAAHRKEWAPVGAAAQQP